jgi:hypothetical protein
MKETSLRHREFRRDRPLAETFAPCGRDHPRELFERVTGIILGQSCDDHLMDPLIIVRMGDKLRCKFQRGLMGLMSRQKLRDVLAREGRADQTNRNDGWRYINHCSSPR